MVNTIKKINGSLKVKSLNGISKIVSSLGFKALAKDAKKAKTKRELEVIRDIVIKDLRVQAGRRFSPISKKIQVISNIDPVANKRITVFKNKFDRLIQST